MPWSPRSILPSAPMVVATPRLLPDGAKNKTRLPRVEGRIVRAQPLLGGLYREAMDVRPPDPPLTDGVVTLRPWSLDDIPALAAACDDPEIARWMHQVPSPYTEGDAREYILMSQAAWRDRRNAIFAVLDCETDEVVGSCAMHIIDAELENVEVGYWT